MCRQFVCGQFVLAPYYSTHQHSWAAPQRVNQLLHCELAWMLLLPVSSDPFYRVDGHFIDDDEEEGLLQWWCDFIRASALLCHTSLTLVSEGTSAQDLYHF